MRTTTPFVRWGNVVLAVLMTLTVMASTSSGSTAGTATTPERLDAVEWAADCSVTYRLTPSNPEAVAFVRVRYWAYDAVRQQGTEMDAPGDTLHLDPGRRETLVGTLRWEDTGPTTRLYVYLSSFDRQGRSIGSTSRSGLCQPKT